jgi:hypothetical protein
VAEVFGDSATLTLIIPQPNEPTTTDSVEPIMAAMNHMLHHVTTTLLSLRGWPDAVAGDRGNGCYRVEQGLVKITVTSDWGEERIIALGTDTNPDHPTSNEPITTDSGNRSSLRWTTAQLLSLGGWPDAAV